MPLSGMHPDTARPEGRRDRPCEAPATFPQSMPVVNGEAST